MDRATFDEIVNKVAYVDNGTIEVTWTAGGLTGGNCWDGDKYCHARDPEPVPEFDSLDNILAEAVPNITFIQYKKLYQNVEQDTRTEYEYYGNSHIEGYKRITVDAIWNFLNDNELV